MSAMEFSIDAVRELLLPMWVELCFAIFFPLGFLLLRADLRNKPSKAVPGRKPQRVGAVEAQAEKLHKVVEEAIATGHSDNAVKAWRKVQAKLPANAEMLRLIVHALSSVSPGTLVDEVAKHMETHKAVLCNAKSAVAVLDAIAHIQNPELMEEMHKVLRGRLGVPPTYQMYESLLGGHAAAGNERRVLEICSEIRASRQKLTARGYALVIKGFLQRGLLDAALRQVRAMRGQGFYVPPFAVTMLLRVACDMGRAAEILNAVHADVALPQEAITVLLEDCQKRADLQLANSIEHLVRTSANAQFPPAAYDALLKTNVAAADPHSLELFEEMQQVGMRISEGLCVGVLARCAEAKFLRFAEEVARFSRARGSMTIAVYSALMKVYAYCGLYGRACDLYDEIRERGLQPDSLMYGCLMKFAVECGRTELSRELFECAPQLDIQNYMSLIRAAGRDKDVDRAFAVFQKLRGAGVDIDIAAYNCVLDACVCAGDLKRARALVTEMRSISPLDVITYNTLLKGYCAVGDMRSGKELFREMERDGLKPNDISYNCMINAAVSSGNFREAWETIDAMEAAGLKIDSYTVSIMMKALKRERGTRDLHRALALLDRAGLDVCADEVLLNTAVETCVRHREMRRLADLVAVFEKSDMKPSLHTYGSLIKACSTLQRLGRCRELWNQMVEDRGMEPNDIVLGCMLDALVCNECVTEAVALFRKWKGKVGANMVMYSTLVKGFAADGRAREAMEMWSEIRAEGGKMNTVVYNALIDAQARAGAMEEVSQLVAGMEPDGVKPDAITYSTIVKGYCVKGHLEKALEVFRNMQRTGLATDCVVYNTVLDGCTRHNRMDLADIVLEDLEKNCVTPSNFTLGIMVKMYGRRRQLDKAFELVASMPLKHGFVANAQVKTCLISACLSNCALARAFQVFEDLKQMGPHAIDAKAYGVMISGCVRAGRVEQAVQLVEEAYGLNGNRRVLPPSQNLWAENLEQLIRVLTQKGLQQKVGVPLLDNLRAAGAPLNGRLLSSALAGEQAHNHRSGGGAAGAPWRQRGAGGPM